MLIICLQSQINKIWKQHFKTPTILLFLSYFVFTSLGRFYPRALLIKHVRGYNKNEPFELNWTENNTFVS
jgi:hypothetical protein